MVSTSPTGDACPIGNRKDRPRERSYLSFLGIFHDSALLKGVGPLANWIVSWEVLWP